MRIYKELYIKGSKEELEQFVKSIYLNLNPDWIKSDNKYLLKDNILIDYIGNKLPHAEVSIYCGENYLFDGEIRVMNIVPFEKDQLTISEYNAILDLFYLEVIKPYSVLHKDINISGPTTDVFDPLNYISKDALEKLKSFCNNANKSTGALHPSDEKRWFDFIIQTVKDEKTFEYNTLYNFLCDEDYWGEKDSSFNGVMGDFAWSKDKASELAFDYENYVRFLQYYLSNTK